MSQYDDDFDGDESNLVKDLRKQLNAEKKAREELEGKFTTTSKQLSELRLRDVLSERKVPAKVAKWMIKDEVDVADSTAVDAWLEENSDVFGYTAPEPVADDTRDELERMDAAESSALPARNDLSAQIVNTESKEALDALLAKFGNVKVPGMGR